MKIATAGILVAILSTACSNDNVRFGTEAYRRLPPDERNVLRREYLQRQGRRAEDLHAACAKLGTVHGDMVARQYGRWAQWSRLAEDDPVMTEHVLTLWRKEYSRARKMRHRPPRTMEELAGWLIACQNGVTGSWAPPEAPLWLAVGETAEAVRVLGWDQCFPDTVLPPIFLSIMHRPEAAREVFSSTYEAASRAGISVPIRELSWLPWLRRVTQDFISWDSEWDRELRLFCDGLLLDPVSGGYRCREGSGLDIATTYRLAMGWNPGGEVLSWLPSPQTMAASILAAADTLGEDLRPEAASLLVGALADLDSLGRHRSCSVLTGWARHAADRIALGVHGPSLRSSMILLGRAGGRRTIAGEWLASFGCEAMTQYRLPDLAESPPLGATAPSLADLEVHTLAVRMRADGG